MSIKNEVVLFGTGELAQVAHVYLEKDSAYRVVAYTAHESRIAERQVRGLPVVPFERLTESHPPDRYAMLVAVGYRRVNKLRAEIYGACKERGYELISYVSSKASQWGEIAVGDNCLILEQNVIQPFVKIGNDVIVWSGNHIGHHATIGDHCFIASHAVISGMVKIGAYSFVGVNATFRDGVTVAPECVIGAGALILKDTVPKGVYRGVRSEAAPFDSTQLKGF